MNLAPILRTFELSDSSHFVVHSYLSDRQNDPVQLVFLPGLGESKAGLFYVFHQWALFFHNLGYSCHLLDLAGNGDSVLPLNPMTWLEQIQVLRKYFKGKKIAWVSRGLSSSVLPRERNSLECVFALNPTVPNLFRNNYQEIQFVKNFLEAEHETPKNHTQLSPRDSLFWHNLGAEAECLGSLSLPFNFFEEISKIVYSEIPEFWNVFQSRDFYVKNHPNILGKDVFMDAHPLFFLEVDRLRMREIIHHILIKSGFVV